MLLVVRPGAPSSVLATSSWDCEPVEPSQCVAPKAPRTDVRERSEVMDFGGENRKHLIRSFNRYDMLRPDDLMACAGIGLEATRGLALLLVASCYW